MMGVLSVGSYATITATHRGRFTLKGPEEFEIFMGVPMDAFEVLP